MNSGYSENNFARVFQRDFESLFVAVIINLWLLLMASSRRRTYIVAEAARHILEGDGCELDWIDVDIHILFCYLSEKIPMTANANNNNSRGRLPGTGDREMCSRRNSVVFRRCILLFMLHILYQCIDNLILLIITLNSSVNKSIVRVLGREK